ncbi:hypothetical protein KOY48_01990 [Candidatus Minimicrobia naudis]|uniref:Uncharacterized protein n=1 Tax=Candidatus Minimicrobia naudis TaxID=2841263 RepID=A0A8F1MBV1_9BACT|nr:hypothetical protein KOY48_01990 [Candidatus Minimicrobia naudis]
MSIQSSRNRNSRNPAPAMPESQTQPEIPQPARNSSEPTLAEIEEELRKKRQQLSVPGRE